MARLVSSVFGVAVLSTAAHGAMEIPDGQMPLSTNPSDALYRCVTVVTGTRIETRLPGFAECLGVALVKLTGDGTVRDDPRFASAAEHAQDDVERFSYHDRMAGIPVHDEQGTHDRPYNLTVDFDHARLNALAGQLGRRPWPLPRPRVAVLLSVENSNALYVLTRDGSIDLSRDMREALADAADKSAIPIILPSQAEVASRGWTFNSLPSLDRRDATAFARTDGGEVALLGQIAFREKALGWVVRWRMEHDGKTYEWGTRGVNFDSAFRLAMIGAAQIMAGRGAPR